MKKTMSRRDKLLFFGGLACHGAGIVLAEWADVRWFLLVLLGEGLWLLFAGKGKSV